MKWTKFCELVLIIRSRVKMWIVRVLPLGVLDEIAWFSSLVGHLVSSGGRVPRKRVKSGDFATVGTRSNNELTSLISFYKRLKT
jgi:hypothetical protein